METDAARKAGLGSWPARYSFSLKAESGLYLPDMTSLIQSDQRSTTFSTCLTIHLDLSCLFRGVISRHSSSEFVLEIGYILWSN
jgi:hypothetical protein